MARIVFSCDAQPAPCLFIVLYSMGVCVHFYMATHMIGICVILLFLFNIQMFFFWHSIIIQMFFDIVFWHCFCMFCAWIYCVLCMVFIIVFDMFLFSMFYYCFRYFVIVFDFYRFLNDLHDFWRNLYVSEEMFLFTCDFWVFFFQNFPGIFIIVLIYFISFIYLCIGLWEIWTLI